jgi:hypothetical protein
MREAQLFWLRLFFRGTQFQQRSRIKVFAVPAHGKVQVWSRGAPGPAAERNKLPC